MMKKAYKLENLGCAHCASQMEEAIGKLDGVTKASVNFMLAKLKLESESNDTMPSKETLQAIISRYEVGCRLV